ncbi:Vegetative cell wall protein gp1-like [Actinidia chinensis var. chinensis]|uniref:Vegetative cell wall protein gp1-like n=1 Tax=Actinidia chinensis var. chinensis TaxID=1590841 RepID=A0A2R6S371_ACTCC|nr:Vegetative cell wall protein gp1-like [Actinidia chinensis var. chinensis]
MVGIEGIVVGVVGSEVAAGSGGRVTLGVAGIVGNAGIFDKDVGIWVLGSGGSIGFGELGAVGIGNGGNVGTVWSKWRAATVTWMPENDITTREDQSMMKISHLRSWVTMGIDEIFEVCRGQMLQESTELERLLLV